MKNRIKRIIFSVLLIGVLIMPCIPVSAVDSYGYYLEFTVTDTGGTARTNVPVLLSSLIGSNLVSAGYIDSDGLDTRLKEITTAMEYMLATTQGAMIIPTLAAYQTKTYRLYMDYSPDTTGFPIIVGEGGYVTVTDAAALELGNNFEIEVSGYMDTSIVGDFAISKGSSFILYNSAASEITGIIGTSASTPITNTSANTDYDVYGANYYGQTFTPAANYILDYVIMSGSERGDVTAGMPLYLNIYATSGGVPTGSSLSTTTIDASAWGGATERTLTLSKKVLLTSGTKYAFVLSCPNADAINYPDMRYQNTSVYAGGTTIASSNSGATWSTTSGDAYFKIGAVSYLAVTAAAIASDDMIVKVTADGTNLKLYVDGVEKDSEALAGASMINSSNNWLLFQNSVMPYVDYYKHTVGGTLIAKYQPAAMLTSTTIPDLEGAAQNGTITWGSNSDLTVTMLGITPFTSYVSTAGESSVADTVNPAEMPASWYSDITDISSMPFYETFNDKATEMGMPTQTLYVMMMLGTAVAVGLGVLVFTGSAMAAVLSCGVAIAAGVNTGMLSGWMLLIFFIFGVGVLYLARQN